MAARTKRPGWIDTLEHLMQKRGLTPRSLSLAAGLNETAVRDMMAGRAKFPRYDTLSALAGVLGTTPAYLMGDESAKSHLKFARSEGAEDLELLTEVIARVMEVGERDGHLPKPEKFARIVAALYQQIAADGKELSKKELSARVRTIFAYDVARGNKVTLVKKA